MLYGSLASNRPPLHRAGGVIAPGVAGDAVHRCGRETRRAQPRGGIGRRSARVELRADLHLHTWERERFIAYDAQGMIDRAARSGCPVLSITNPATVTFRARLQDS